MSFVGSEIPSEVFVTIKLSHKDFETRSIGGLTRLGVHKLKWDKVRIDIRQDIVQLIITTIVKTPK